METSMRRSPINLGRLGAAAAVTAIVASVALVAPVSANATGTGTVAVSGTSSSKVQVSLETTAAFGTGLTPDGAVSSTSITGFTGANGACYPWSGTLTIKANVGYKVDVTSSGASITRLHFLPAGLPATYAACTAGTLFSAMPLAWIASAPKTPSQADPYGVGLEVQWLDDPATLAASLVFTVTGAS
jgi:hypothetical protein